jgi:hypothetical protein
LLARKQMRTIIGAELPHSAHRFATQRSRPLLPPPALASKTTRAGPVMYMRRRMRRSLESSHVAVRCALSVLREVPFSPCRAARDAGQPSARRARRARPAGRPATRSRERRRCALLRVRERPRQAHLVRAERVDQPVPARIRATADRPVQPRRESSAHRGRRRDRGQPDACAPPGGAHGRDAARHRHRHRAAGGEASASDGARGDAARTAHGDRRGAQRLLSRHCRACAARGRASRASMR